MTEAEMRETEVPTPGSVEELADYVRSLVEREHDYGTCVYAMSMAATATFNFVASKLGVTGFQASCADLDILRRTRDFKWGRLLDYEKLLYPQHRDEFPSWEELLDQNRNELAKRATMLLATSDYAADRVKEHWRRLIANADGALVSAKDGYGDLISGDSDAK